jgi:glycerol-3-phosphate acyltransferase PlsX
LEPYIFITKSTYKEKGIINMRILVDAMGGDNAPDEIVKGCVDAINLKQGFEIELLGDRRKIEKCFTGKQFDRSRIIITETRDDVTNYDKPSDAIRKKKDSSLVIGMKKIKDNAAHAFISAGNTGAILAASLLIAGRIKGIVRPALAPIVPSINGPVMIVDAGMNTRIKPISYLQFAVMGTEYMKVKYGMDNPRVGLVNIGTEENKGNEIHRQAYEILRNSQVNFIGNIEGKDVPEGNVDIVVCDGFVGNAMLKVMEGTGKYFFNHLGNIYSRSIWGKISYLFVKHELKKIKKQVDPEEIGGTPILGVNGMVFKCHGNSKAKAIKNTILNACSVKYQSVMVQVKNSFVHMKTNVQT